MKGKPNLALLITTLNRRVQGPIWQRHFGMLQFSFPASRDDHMQASLNHQNLAEQKRLLRKVMRARRNALSKAEQDLANIELFKQLKRSQLLLRFRHIALYIGSDGELDISSCQSSMQQFGVTTYLPVIHPSHSGEMQIHHAPDDAKLRLNRYGIPEPDIKVYSRIPASCLSAIFMPLVAFDLQGQRLGMGGGYYDRFLGRLMTAGQRRPKLIGIAHSFQKVDHLPIEDWDIPLDAVLTDKAFHAFSI